MIGKKAILFYKKLRSTTLADVVEDTRQAVNNE